MGAAVEEGLIPSNPCQIKGGGKASTAHDEEIATEDEMRIMWEAMPERARLAILLAGLTALRSGEIRELRREDIDLGRGLLHVRRRGSASTTSATPPSPGTKWPAPR
jgi:integrase